MHRASCFQARASRREAALLLAAACLAVAVALRLPTAQAQCSFDGRDFSSLMGTDIIGTDNQGDRYVYYLSICGKLTSAAASTCTETQPTSSACQIEQLPNLQTFDIGDWNPSAPPAFSYVDDTKQAVTYKMTGAVQCWAYGGNALPYVANVVLQCAKSQGPLVVTQESQSCEKTYTLPTPLACGGGDVDPHPVPDAAVVLWSGGGCSGPPLTTLSALDVCTPWRSGSEEELHVWSAHCSDVDKGRHSFSIGISEYGSVESCNSASSFDVRYRTKEEPTESEYNNDPEHCFPLHKTSTERVEYSAVIRCPTPKSNSGPKSAVIASIVLGAVAVVFLGVLAYVHRERVRSACSKLPHWSSGAASELADQPMHAHVQAYEEGPEVVSAQPYHRALE